MMDNDDIATLYGGDKPKRNHPGNIMNLPAMTSEIKKLQLNKTQLEELVTYQQQNIDILLRKVRTLEANFLVMNDQLASLNRNVQRLFQKDQTRS